MRLIEGINAGLLELMTRDPQLHLIGEDILDPYGGAFKATIGLSTKFPGRVISTPISEAAMVGVGLGMAMRGKPAIVEIMFGDFLTLCMDQLLNHATKISWLHGEDAKLPLIVRTPMGGRRGYGPSHSQCIEKHFCGIPGLYVFAYHQYTDPKILLKKAYDLRQPCLMIENKTLYARKVDIDTALCSNGNPDLVIVTYGGSVEVAVKAASALAAEEISVEIFPVTQLSPFPEEQVRNISTRCRRVLSVEEGADGWGFSAQVAKSLTNCQVYFDYVSSAPQPIPASRVWEIAVLPDEAKIVDAAIKLLSH